MKNPITMQTFTTLKENLVKIAKVFLHYSLIISSLLFAFTIGYYFNHIVELNSKKMPDVIKRSEVTIAIDETQNIMIITKQDGSYTLMQDSVGRSIFNMYANKFFQETKVETTNE